MDIDLTPNDNQPNDDPFGSELLQKFSCLNTNDREVLMKEFRMYIGDKMLSDEKVEFWLDMSNWNLQAAIGSYFDFEASGNQLVKLPSAEIDVFDKDMAQQFEFYPNIPFVYKCKVINSGDEPWPHGCTIRFCSGTQMSSTERFVMPDLQPKKSFQVTLPLTSPNKAGSYFSQWRFSTLTGQFFGDQIFVIVNVIDDINQVAKQLSAAHIVDQQHQQQQQQIQNYEPNNGENNKFNSQNQSDLITNNEGIALNNHHHIHNHQMEHNIEATATILPQFNIINNNGEDQPML